MQTNIERLPRFVRHRFRKPEFVLQARDREVVQLVSQHRVISSEDIRLLIPGSDQTILRRLQKLFHHGYLDRPRSQRQLGNAPMVYALGQQGAALITRESGCKPSLDWSEKNREMGSRYLEHALMVSRFQAALSYAAGKVGTVGVESWHGDGAVREAVYVESKAGPERIAVAPDAYFVLNVSDGEASGRVHIFVEADRSTMTLARFVTKLRGYFGFWQSGQAEQKLGMKNFLVVTSTTSKARTDHLLRACREVNGQGLRMFLFGTETDYLPASGAVIFDPLWRTPATDSRHSLIE